MAIVLLHVIGTWVAEIGWGGVSPLRRLLDGVLVQALVRWAVPVFVMISGFLLLKADKEMPLSKIRKYVLRMVLVLLSFGYVYCLIECIVTRGLAGLPTTLLLSAKNLIEGKSWEHMRYVYDLLGLYLLTPMLRVFVKHADRQTMRWTLAGLFLVTIVWPTLNKAANLELAPLIHLSSPFLCYYLMGGYLTRWTIAPRFSLCATLIGCIGLLTTELLEYGGHDFGAGAPDHFFTALYAIGLFSLAKDSKILARVAQNRVISSISRYSFGIYLIHPFFLNLLFKGLHTSLDALPIVISELVYFVAALSFAFGVTWVLTRIKPIAKIL